MSPGWFAPAGRLDGGWLVPPGRVVGGWFVPRGRLAGGWFVPPGRLVGGWFVPRRNRIVRGLRNRRSSSLGMCSVPFRASLARFAHQFRPNLWKNQSSSYLRRDSSSDRCDAALLLLTRSRAVAKSGNSLSASSTRPRRELEKWRDAMRRRLCRTVRQSTSYGIRWWN